jgi:membrane protein DedA with SNARE-associated domain
VSSHEITHLVHEYGLALVFAATAVQAVGFPIPGTTALIAAALYAATAHGLPIVGVIAAGALGALVGTTAAFALGRWRGEGLVRWTGRRLRQTPERVTRLRDEFATRGGILVFVGRFITGLRNLVGLFAGAAGMPLRRFMPISAAAALAWALLNGLEYYFFGHAIAGASTWVQVALVCVGIVWMLVSLNFLRRRALRRLGEHASATELS